MWVKQNHNVKRKGVKPMNRIEYSAPVIDIVVMDAEDDLITTSEWDLPEYEW